MCMWVSFIAFISRLCPTLNHPPIPPLHSLDPFNRPARLPSWLHPPHPQKPILGFELHTNLRILYVFLFMSSFVLSIMALSLFHLVFHICNTISIYSKHGILVNIDKWTVFGLFFLHASLGYGPHSHDAWHCSMCESKVKICSNVIKAAVNFSVMPLPYTCINMVQGFSCIMHNRGLDFFVRFVFLFIPIFNRLLQWWWWWWWGRFLPCLTPSNTKFVIYSIAIFVNLGHNLFCFVLFGTYFVILELPIFLP